jgi:hypothetical protein
MDKTGKKALEPLNVLYLIQLTPRNTVLENLIVAQVTKNFSIFSGTEVSLQFSEVHKKLDV